MLQYSWNNRWKSANVQLAMQQHKELVLNRIIEPISIADWFLQSLFIHLPCMLLLINQCQQLSESAQSYVYVTKTLSSQGKPTMLSLWRKLLNRRGTHAQQVPISTYPTKKTARIFNHSYIISTPLHHSAHSGS